MDWLTYFGKESIRISDEDHLYELSHIDIRKNSVSIRIKNDLFNYDLADVEAVWHWHGETTFENLAIFEIERFSTNKVVVTNLQRQMSTVYGFIYEYINTKRVIGNLHRQEVNKLTMLRWAAQLGIDIPDTFIGTKMEQIKEQAADKVLITKSIQESPTIANDKNEKILTGYTVKVTSELLGELPQEQLFPSLVQEMLDKRYELRIFYLDGAFYPMAILSQRDKQTEVDFRRYNNEKPNRMINCSIPSVLQEKITKLMQLSRLNCGSLDFVKTKDGRYVFLEVNPVGQFGFVASNCNYPLEKYIAEKLITS